MKASVGKLKGYGGSGRSYGGAGRSALISCLFYGINVLPWTYVMQSEPEFRPAMSEVVLYLLNMIRKESQQSEWNEKWEW